MHTKFNFHMLHLPLEFFLFLQAIFLHDGDDDG